MHRLPVSTTPSSEEMPARHTLRRKRILRGSTANTPGVTPRVKAIMPPPALLNVQAAFNEAVEDFSITLGDIAFRFMPISMKEYLTITKN